MDDIAVLAVDAGATNCRAVLCAQDGHVLGYSQGGPCNYQSIGELQAKRTLTDVLTALVPAGQYPLRVKRAVFGIAGLDTQGDRQVLIPMVAEALAAACIQAEDVLLDNDAMMTLLGAVGPEPGVLIIAGTGSIACGITPDGRQARAGGWGHRIGDEGSGFAIGKAALVHIMRAYDGREGTSAITDHVLQQLGMVCPEEIVNWVYGREYTVDKVASLAPILCRLAEAGDWKAREIINQASREVVHAAMVVINTLHLKDETFKLVLLGGVIQQNRYFCAQVIELIGRECSRVTVSAPRYAPICGGILNGLMSLGIAHQDVLERLSRELARESLVND